MNERIGQLAEQAGLLGPSSRIGNSHDATERFAELIVRECADVAGRDVGHFVLKHFEVKEQSTEPNRLHTLARMQKKFIMTMKHCVIVMKNSNANVQWMFN